MMDKKKISQRYYVYGCEQLLEDIKEIMESAAYAENSGKTSNEWLNYHDLESITKDLTSDLSWGAAIKVLLISRTRQLDRIRDERLTDDFPF